MCEAGVRSRVPVGGALVLICLFLMLPLAADLLERASVASHAALHAGTIGLAKSFTPPLEAESESRRYRQRMRRGVEREDEDDGFLGGAGAFGVHPRDLERAGRGQGGGARAPSIVASARGMASDSD